MELKYIFSERNEIERIQSTIKKIAWYREQNYKLVFPNNIKDLPDDMVTDELVKQGVREEFEEERYEEIAKEIENKWSAIKDEYQKNLKKLGLPLQDVYLIYFTKYGVGGSYNLPNKIILNVSGKRDKLSIITHEIVHLAIEALIEKYKIDHWTKERIVDLIHNRFRNENELQRDPENSQEIQQIFEKYFPDITKVISEIGAKNFTA
jgi:hypothetical protein